MHHLIDGSYENEQCKPDDEAVLMKLSRKLLNVKQSQYVEYNLQVEFLHRPINIVLGNRRVDTVLNLGPEAYLHSYICLMAPGLVGDLSLQGTIGAEMKEFNYSILSE